MHILFVGSHRADKQFSIMGFEQALARHLSGRCQFEVVFPAGGNRGRGASKWRRYAEKYIFFPRVLRKRAAQVDLVHFCEKGMGLNAPHVKRKPSLVTVHDFLAVEAAKGEMSGWEVSRSGQRYQALIVKGVMHASAIACVSETTMTAFRRHMPHFKGPARTILNGMYKEFRRVGEEQAQARIEPLPWDEFFFHIGGNKPYKNRGGALQVFAEILRQDPSLPTGLVMAGAAKTEELRSMERDLGLTGRVQWILEPSDEQVEAYYSLATALIFPSWAEGFGLPIIEAQSCGCPVFASNRPPMTEVGESSVVYFDPSYPVESANQILSHMDNLDELRKRGSENVKRFDPQVMADKYLEYYCDLLQR
ncbi:MAG: glycosyltransferase family 4 protein [Armatimonadetes bacterium]|nr:glycosyltransferase family 4 protein [Armatimonadota bacterium]